MNALHLNCCIIKINIYKVNWNNDRLEQPLSAQLTTIIATTTLHESILLVPATTTINARPLTQPLLSAPSSTSHHPIPQALHSLHNTSHPLIAPTLQNHPLVAQYVLVNLLLQDAVTTIIL